MSPHKANGGVRNGRGDVFITGLGRFLPGPPIPSESIEEFIGSVGSQTSKLRERVVENSGIRTRHYAIDREQRTQISAAGMAAKAIEGACASADTSPSDVDLLAVATTINDVIAPGIASQVHGLLESPPCEIASYHGICSCGMMALKGAYQQVALGEKAKAIASASEFTSRILKSSRFGAVETDADENIAMEMAFLRYMLSDGAGAAMLEPRPAIDRMSFRVEWVTVRSYGNTPQACMYLGSANGDLARTWIDYPAVEEAVHDGALALRQDLTLLPRVVQVGVDEYERLYDAGMIEPDRIKYVAAHYSSEIMRRPVLRELERRACKAPSPDAWYTNLHSVGNIGCAAIYVILEELIREADLEAGDQVLCFVPESGRFTIAYMLLTLVAPDGAPRS
jgi:3-oxoacyl-[acyl-carrier-protein] synthase-3